MLVSDFDGTLSEIVPSPDEARPVDGAVAVLETLARTLLKVAILSSRSTKQLRLLLPVAGVELMGDYGLRGLAEQDAEKLREFNALASRAISTWPGVHLESKPGSTSVHYRAAPVARASLAETLVPLAEQMGLLAAFGRAVLEVRPRVADKSTSAARLVREVQPQGVIYLGDDENDRAVFELLTRLPVQHFSVGVASGEVRRELFTACDLIVDAPAEAVELLSQLAGWAEAATPPRGRAAGDRSSG